MGLNFSSGRITGSYSTGVVTDSGLVGSKRGISIGFPSITSSFWNTETSGRSRSDGGTGLTTAEMQDINTFLNAGGDFMGETVNGTEDIWWILGGQDTPRLWWELDEP